MVKRVWIFGLVLFLMACNNNAESTVSADSVQENVPEQIKTVDMQESFPGLFSFLKKQDSSLTLEKFTPAEASTISSLAAMPIDDNLKKFTAYFIYNPDSSLAIDLYSYNHFQKEKQGITVLEMAGPDSEVALVDFNKKTRQRILFTGPAISLLDAKWTAAKEILLAGAEQIDDEKIKPLLWRINLADSHMVSFSYHDTLQAKVYNYVEEKFKTTIRTSPSF